MFSSEFGPGTVVANRFEVENEAGSGGMGVVYRAKDQNTGAPVALKLLKTRNDEPSRERFMREGLLLAELRHPGIVSYVAHGQLPDGQSYLVMDWLSGEELATRLHRGPLTLSRSVALLQRLTDALAAAHRRGIVHRDIKPSNIYLVNGQVEQAVLVDFGIARHGGEKMMRQALALASQLAHGFLRQNAQMVLMMALAERSEPELLVEGDCLAQLLIDTGVSPLYVATAQTARARIMLAWGRADEAEEAVRKACAIFPVAPPLLVAALAVQIAVLLARGRVDAAVESAEEGLRIVTSLGGAGYMEIPLRAAAAEAFHATGDVPRAQEAVREALRQIDLRASKITDPAWRARYLTGRPENARVFLQARDWLGDEKANQQPTIRMSLP